MEELELDHSKVTVPLHACINNVELARYLLGKKCNWDKCFSVEKVWESGGGCEELYKHDKLGLSDLCEIRVQCDGYHFHTLDSLLEWNATKRFIDRAIATAEYTKLSWDDLNTSNERVRQLCIDCVDRKHSLSGTCQKVCADISHCKCDDCV